MLRIGKALEELVAQNNFLEFGLSEGLLNLAATAEWIKPFVEGRTKKEVSRTALQMALTRLRRQRGKVKKPLQKFKLRGINIKSDMTELTFANSPANRKLLYGYFASGSEENLLSVNTSNREITVVVPQAQVERFRQAVSPLQTIFEKKDLSAVCIDFQPEYVMEPYLLYYLIQQITLQNINIWELASTYTEIIFYVEEKDVSLAFDTLYRKFMLR